MHHKKKHTMSCCGPITSSHDPASRSLSTTAGLTFWNVWRISLSGSLLHHRTAAELAPVWLSIGWLDSKAMGEASYCISATSKWIFCKKVYMLVNICVCVHVCMLMQEHPCQTKSMSLEDLKCPATYIKPHSPQVPNSREGNSSGTQMLQKKSKQTKNKCHKERQGGNGPKNWHPPICCFEKSFPPKGNLQHPNHYITACVAKKYGTWQETLQSSTSSLHPIPLQASSKKVWIFW